MNRPFYTTFAWAYDLLVPGPVKERIDFIVTQLRDQRVPSGARLLDAGCGTGTYALALAQRGFMVTGVDASTDLIAQAKRKGADAEISLDFVIGDILRLPEELSVDAILCRGVLNDLTDEESRGAVFSSFGAVMGEGGVLILDVREWHSTTTRKTQNPVFEKTVMTGGGRLTFRSLTTLRPETHSLLISETHILQSTRGRDAATFDFEMKCWTHEEVADHLAASGFDIVRYFGDYDAGKPVGTTDRLVAVAVMRR